MSDRRKTHPGNAKWCKYRPIWNVAIGTKDFLRRVIDADPDFDPACGYNVVIAMMMRDGAERRRADEQ